MTWRWPRPQPTTGESVWLTQRLPGWPPRRPRPSLLTLSEASAAWAAADWTGRPRSTPLTSKAAMRHHVSEVQGLAALSDVAYRDIAVVAVPGAPSDVVRAVVQHCEATRHRFVIVDAPSGLPLGFDPRSAIADSSYAALYTPWLIVADLVDSRQRRTVPPSGHVAGIYARTDSERGVHKAPANEVVQGVLGVTDAIDDHDQDALNPLGINALRNFPGRGLVVWGARTLSSDPQWKYVNVRRLCIYLERSIDEGTRWVVFEPNSEDVWKRVATLVQDFLYKVWRSGALQGSVPEQAFFVRCDRSTMTQSDVDNGRLICEIGVAPVRPAEFVIIRIGQRTSEAGR